MAEAYLHTVRHLDPSSRLATTEMGRKLGAVPLWGRGSWVPIQNVTSAEAYLHAKFHFDPFNRLATIHQRHRKNGTDGQTGQRSDCIRRTALQTVAQKWLPWQRPLVADCGQYLRSVGRPLNPLHIQ